MVNITINQKQVQVPDHTTILSAAASVGIKIPTLCYLKDINEIGACRVCLVEIAGKDTLVAACNNVVEDGMVIYTNSPKVRTARRTNVEMILSQHDFRCATCVRSGNCTLQTISNDLGITSLPYEQNYEENNWNQDFPLIRDASKCVKCFRCVQICDKVQSLNIWDIANTGRKTTIGVTGGGKIEDSACAVCGQCITHCPVGALRERNDTDRFMDAIADPEKIVVVQIAPAVRAAWGEALGIPRNKATVNKIVAALKMMGVDYVLDTNFSADLTIMEEGSELIERLTHKEDYAWPMYTSCCPGWVRFLKGQYPEQTKQLSTAKSPQQMFGAVIKTFFAQKNNIDPKNIFSVSIMPCTAKKHEVDIPVMNDSGYRDLDMTLTTRELDRLIKAENIIPELLKEEAFDYPFGTGTGAGVIFGATGGVMEAALRSAYYLITGKNPDADEFKVVRGMDGIKEATVEINNIPVRAAVVSGLGNTRKLIEQMKNGEKQYDFVEVMACPGGCAGGGGQPICDGIEMADVRGQRLYDLDVSHEIRFSHDNPEIHDIYENFLEKPLSHKAHELLHTDHDAWKMPNEA
jgi:NADH-quinone oxidoreductase subunit G